MEIRLAQRVGRVRPSPTLAVTARAAALRAAGRDVIGLGAGEPDFDTPEHIKEAAIRALREGLTKYTPVDGLPALKKAVCEKLRRENGLAYAPEQILVSCGAKHSFYNLAQALLDPGDEVVIPAPYWVSYPDMVLLAGGEPRIVSAGLDQGFKLTPAQLEAAIGPRTRMVVINSPSNPTGAAYSRAELAALGEVLLRHPEVVVVSDDIYEHILWSGEPFVNIVNACPELQPRTVVINGVSKAYAMTGWRIGYAAGPARLIGAMKTIQSQSTSNPTSIAQYAAIEALNGDQSMIPEQCAVFRQRHDFVREQMNRIEGVQCPASDGTFYSFPNMQGVIDRMENIGNDIELAEHLLEQAGVAMVPGSAFGAPGYMRLSFATSMEVLEQAMERLQKTLA